MWWELTLIPPWLIILEVLKKLVINQMNLERETNFYFKTIIFPEKKSTLDFDLVIMQELHY